MSDAISIITPGDMYIENNSLSATVSKFDLE